MSLDGTTGSGGIFRQDQGKTRRTHWDAFKEFFAGIDEKSTR
jgi:hypothetical protein